jgi:hypothetical protein
VTAPQATSDTPASAPTTPVHRKPPTWDQIREGIPAPGTPEGAYFHYTPAEAAEWLPFGAHKLRKMAHAREVEFVDSGNRVWFSGLNIRAISEQFTVRPFTKPARAAA